MVAPGTISRPSVRPASSQVSRMGYGDVQFTVADALSMVEKGILPEDSSVELLDGSLVYRDRFDLRREEVAEGFKHSYAVSKIGDLKSKVDDARRHLRTQCTLICTDTHAPIPDGLILRGMLNDYSTLPTAADALCVIEVADSSYERDSGEKLKAYAGAGIEQYVIVNLRNRTAEVYTGPDRTSRTYLPREVIVEGHALSLRIGDDELLSVALDELLPKVRPMEG
jgi:hypothetical protein